MSQSISAKKLRAAYQRMLLIREFELRVERLFLAGKITGTAHLCIGQEATAVGAVMALRKSDALTSTHRGHGHFLARGGNPDRIMAELYGKRSGYSGGRGGSQFMADYRIGYLGANGITGGSLSVATGVALAARLQNRSRVTLCFFGDGASNQGVFHECLNMAALWKLPVVFLCENNGYAMSMPVARSIAGGSIARRAQAYGIAGEETDGNDLEAVWRAVTNARRRAAKGDGPTLIECHTYRYCGHSRGDPCVYRAPQEKVAWRKRDPIQRMRRILLTRGVLISGEHQRLMQETRRRVQQAVAHAEADAWPKASSLTKGVFA